MACAIFNFKQYLLHINSCQACMNSGHELVTLLGELLGGRVERVDTRKVSNALYVNSCRARPSTNSSSPFFRDFLVHSFTPNIMKAMRRGGQITFTSAMRKHILPVIGDLRL